MSERTAAQQYFDPPDPTWPCYDCGERLNEEEVVWVNLTTGAHDSKDGEPFCPDHVPPQDLWDDGERE